MEFEKKLLFAKNIDFVKRQFMLEPGDNLDIQNNNDQGNFDNRSALLVLQSPSLNVLVPHPPHLPQMI